MSSSDAGSGPDERSRSASAGVAVVAVVLVGSSVLARSSVVDPFVAVGTSVVLAGLGIVLLWRRSSAPDGDADEGSDVWDAIPSWQYEGRHVESGGLARGEQEQALQDVQDRADELEDRSGR